MTTPQPHDCPNYTRRRFLATIGASVAVAAAGGYGISLWGRDPGVASAAPSPGTFDFAADRTLVVLEMGGGNDGLNMVVPHATPRYHDLRRGLAINDPIDLDGEIGLHPALATVAAKYQTGNVAIVEGVGYPEPDLSHFASMATWWAGQNDDTVGGTGWLGRFLDGTVGADDPLAGVSIGPGPSPAMRGDRSFVVAVQDLSGLSPMVPAWIDDTDELLGMWRGFAPAEFDGASLLDEVRRAIASTVDAATTVNDALGSTQGDDAARPDRRGRRVQLATSMEVAAALITAPSPPRVVVVHGWGDFDTHEGQRNRHDSMMEAMDESLATFFTTLDEAEMSDRVVVMTTSEFGRRAATNGSGTDHGTAASHLIIGNGVNGGRYGTPPDLGSLDTRGNLVHTVDYRSVYATVLEGWLEAPADEILSGTYERPPVFAP